MLGSAIVPFEPPARIQHFAPSKTMTQSGSDHDPVPQALREAIESAEDVTNQANRVLATANAQDALELRNLLAELDSAIVRQDEPEVRSILQKVEDLVFYLQDV